MSRAAGKDDAAYAEALASAVAEVVQKQRQLGVDIPDDGEFGKAVAGTYDYGAWWNYAFARMSGFAPAGAGAQSKHSKSGVAELALTSFANRRDWQKFGAFYLDPESSGSLMGSAARRPVQRPACTGPIKYTGHAALAADIANLKKALAASGVEEGFMCWIGPGSFARGEDHYYKTEEEFLFASADAMHDEYKAIVDAGIVLQIDDPSLPDNWDMINPEPPLAEFKKFEAGAHGGAQSRAARPAGGPHPLPYLLGQLARPAHHRHSAARHRRPDAAASTPAPIRWRPAMSATNTNGASGATSSCPTARCSFPGVVSHATNIVEHPQVVADRIVPTRRWPAAKTSSPEPIGTRRPHPPADRLGQARGAGRRRRGSPGRGTVGISGDAATQRFRRRRWRSLPAPAPSARARATAAPPPSCWRARAPRPLPSTSTPSRMTVDGGAGRQRRRDRHACLRRHRRCGGRRDDGRLPQGVRADRRSGQQRGRLGRGRRRGAFRRGFRPADRVQSQERFSRLPPRHSSHGRAGRRLQSSTPRRPRGPAIPARHRSVMRPRRQRSSNFRG